MYKYMKKHEKFVRDCLKEESQDLNWLKDFHKTQIEFIQHERLVHLIVTMTFALILILSVGFSLAYPNLLLYVMDLIVVIVLAFYILHYYRLENGIQEWYNLYNRIDEKIRCDKLS